MGCVSSKQVIRSRSCKHGNAPAPFPRSCSAHVRHGKDKNHIVSLTSSTLGSLRFTDEDPLRTKSHNDSSHHINGIPGCKRNDEYLIVDNKTEFELGVIEAKEWSQKINRKMNMMGNEKKPETPRTPVRTPTGDPEMINAWEMMAGLDEEPGIDHKNPSSQTSEAEEIGHNNPEIEHNNSSSQTSDAEEIEHNNPSSQTSGAEEIDHNNPSQTSDAEKIDHDNLSRRLDNDDDCHFSSARIEFVAGCNSLGRVGGPEDDDEQHAAHLEPVGVDEEHGEVILKARVSDVDPEFLSAFREALEEYSPNNQFHLGMQNGNNHSTPSSTTTAAGEFSSKLHQQRQEEIGGRSPSLSSNDHQHATGTTTKQKQIIHNNMNHRHHGLPVKKETTNSNMGESVHKERVVLYYTSLRGVRKTYEACCKLRLVLKAMGVRVDERDLSMHSGYKEELRTRLGGDDIQVSKLPQLFLGKKYIGGAEELKQMNEDGRLEEVLEGCQMIEDDPSNGMSPGVGVCEVCGDVRFVPCERCSGSCKIAANEEGGDECGGGEVMEQQPQHQRCPDCNENGLVRCPFCCD